MASLLRLPTEVKVLILQELSPEDLLPIRLTCSLFRDVATPLFIDSYFKTRHIMFERRSLKTLLDISEHVSFASYVRTIEFNLYHLLPVNELEEIEPPFSPYEKMLERIALGSEGAKTIGSTSPQNDRLSGLEVDAYYSQWNDQEELMRTGFALDCLTAAMSNLTQCKNLIFDDAHRPWGLDRMEEVIGILPQRSLTFESGASVRFVRHVLDIALAAAATSRLELEEIDISPGCLMENANRVGPDMLPRLSAPITSVRHLHLVLDSEFSDSAYTWGWETTLLQFVDSFPELTHFMLEFENRDDFFRFSEASPGIQIPRLQRFMIGLVDCSGDDLADFLIRHKGTLRETCFDNINLTDGPMAWHDLIRKIHDQLDITYLSMINCMAEERYTNRRAIRSY